MTPEEMADKWALSEGEYSLVDGKVRIDPYVKSIFLAGYAAAKAEYTHNLNIAFNVKNKD